MPDVLVSGIVAARNNEPYVQLTKDGQVVLQVTMSEARKIAADILLAASRAEADAMIIRFFADRELPAQAAAALLIDFRSFRLGLDLDVPQGSYSPPDDNAPGPPA
jgi:hypothetical protein